jgi:hypothetical protein
MAKKKKAKKGKKRSARVGMVKGMDMAAAVAPSGADKDVVQDAYKESLKKMIEQFFLTSDSNKQVAESNFVNGLGILREARDRALQLV